MTIADQYRKAPGNQMELQIPGFTSAGGELMDEARRWAASHVSEWSWYKKMACEECAGGKKASPNWCLQAMRRHFKCSVPNALAPALARIALEEDSRISFRLSRSKVDGFTTAALQ